MCSNTVLRLSTLRKPDLEPRFMSILENLRYLGVTAGEMVSVVDTTEKTVLFEITGLPGKKWELPKHLFSGNS